MTTAENVIGQINQFLQQMGIPQQLALLPDSSPLSWYTLVDHGGLNGISIFITTLGNGSLTIFITLGVGHVPIQGVAPLLRRMLALNGTLAG